eukprot:jgi/Mesen1/10814/ME000093S10334
MMAVAYHISCGVNPLSSGRLTSAGHYDNKSVCQVSARCRYISFQKERRLPPLLAATPAKSFQGQGKHLLCRAMAEDKEQRAEEADAASTLEALDRLGIGKASRKPVVQKETSKPTPKPDPWNLPPLEKKKWEDMNALEQVGELWLGETGGLYWLNKLAWGAIIGIVVLWVAFRFIGPALGLYQLEANLLDPSDAF